ncbi:MAG: hypothetical protein DRN15_01395 [Thermoprotei archaeon]|nr:MAG: hypothetical protein DRN15_01395 [Thermoprotei archaeon]
MVGEAKSKEEETRLILRELIDGDAIIGAAVLDARGTPLTWVLPPTLDLKAVKTSSALIEILLRVKDMEDSRLGRFIYCVVRFRNVKTTAMDIDGKGYLLLFVSPIWHVELLLPKVRQALNKLRALLL